MHTCPRLLNDSLEEQLAILTVSSISLVPKSVEVSYTDNIYKLIYKEFINNEIFIRMTIKKDKI